MTDDATANPESVFTMDPDKVIESSIKTLIGHLTMLADTERQRRALQARPGAAESGVVERVAEQAAGLRQMFLEDALPAIGAAFKLAIEVRHTHGSGFVVIEDPVEAALWNNKYHVYAREMSIKDRDADTPLGG